MEKGKNTAKLRNDLVLVGIILVLVLICFIIFKLSLKDGEYVNISVNGKYEYSLSLNSDLEKKITTELGENVVVIKNGRVTVKSADCPDKICVEHRAISKAGETIVCLPHKVVVEITEEG